MRTRRSWRNQERLWQELGGIKPPKHRSPQKKKNVPEALVSTEEEPKSLFHDLMDTLDSVTTLLEYHIEDDARRNDVTIYQYCPCMTYDVKHARELLSRAKKEPRCDSVEASGHG